MGWRSRRFKTYASRPFKEPKGDEPKFQIKELLVALPFFGTAAAIAFDVGYFAGIDINLFTLFSLSEHVLFALEALPFGLLAIIVSFVLFLFAAAMRAILEYGVRHADVSISRFKPAMAIVHWIREHHVLIGVVWIGALLLLRFFSQPVDIYIILVRWGLFVIGLLLIAPKVLSPRVILAIIVLATLIGVFALGSYLAQKYRAGSSVFHQIETKNGSLDGRIIRSGERGLLFVDVVSKDIYFLKWDEIKRVIQRMDGHYDGPG